LNNVGKRKQKLDNLLVKWHHKERNLQVNTTISKGKILLILGKSFSEFLPYHQKRSNEQMHIKNAG
jgi:hypothetical protein